MVHLFARIRKFLTSEEGQALAEFGLILAFVAILAIAALALLGPAITKPFTNVVAQGFNGGSGSS